MAGKGQRIAVFTSGGDAQGMNAALRSIVRLALYQHARVYYVLDGYKGLISGALVEATWASVANVIQTGGTFIGSARSKEFTTREGRAKAAAALATHSISALVCIGGDGSLTGLQALASEWPSHMTELLAAGILTREAAENARHLAVVGIVGSIDNDFASSDMTIGTDSALTRIVEAIDSVVDTAQSHQRTFVIEVMGRACGYLALTAALATEADFVFVPEWPPGEDWPDAMCARLAHMRKLGRRLNVIIVAEGATDNGGKKITPEDVQRVVEQRLKYDTRVTKLGHVQRGGRASFLDRLLGTRMGAEAVATILNPSLATTPYVIAIEGNKLKRVPLARAIERNQLVASAFAAHDRTAVVRLRGKTFAEKVEYLNTTALVDKPLLSRRSRSDSSLTTTTEESSERTDSEVSLGPSRPALAVMHVGAPAAGMNAVTHSFVRSALAAGYDVYGVHDSLTGLEKGKLEPLAWSSVAGWVGRGGSMLGTKKERVEEPYAIAGTLSRYSIHGLLIVGGFEAYSASLALAALRPMLNSLRIPIAVVPATISNNVPGTRVSIGSDTALNEIARLIDACKQSAEGTRARSFIVETQGGKSGYLAAMGGIAGAADAIHIFEEPTQQRHIVQNIEEAERRVSRHDSPAYLLVRGEGCQLKSAAVLEAFQKSDKMSARLAVFGHVQQGGAPSVFDRQMGLRMGAKALSTLISLSPLSGASSPVGVDDAVVMIGLQGSSLRSTSCASLRSVACFSHRTHSDTHWWRRLTVLARILASDEKAALPRPEKIIKSLEYEPEVEAGEAKVDVEVRSEGGGEDAKENALPSSCGDRVRLAGLSHEMAVCCVSEASVAYDDDLVEYEDDDSD